MLFSLIESASCKKGNHMQIAGSSAIVVGGAGGLGEATVRRLHGAGAKVVVADLADDKGKALESELGVRYVPTDATSEESVNAAIAEAVSLAPLRISVDTHGGPAAGARAERHAEPGEPGGVPPRQPRRAGPGGAAADAGGRRPEP